MGNSDESSELFSSDLGDIKLSDKTVSSSSTYFSGAELPSSSGSDGRTVECYRPCIDQCGNDEVDCRPVPLLRRLTSGRYHLSWPRRLEVVHNGRRRVTMVPSWLQSPLDEVDSPPTVVDCSAAGPSAAPLDCRPAAERLVASRTAAGPHSADAANPRDMDPPTGIVSANIVSVRLCDEELTAADLPQRDTAGLQCRWEGDQDSPPNELSGQSALVDTFTVKREQCSPKDSPAKRIAYAAGDWGDGVQEAIILPNPVTAEPISNQWCFIPRSEYLDSSLRAASAGTRDQRSRVAQQTENGGGPPNVAADSADSSDEAAEGDASKRLELKGLLSYVGTVPCVVMLTSSMQFTSPDNEQKYLIYD